MKKIILFSLIITLLSLRAYSLEASSAYIPGKINLAQEALSNQGILVARPTDLGKDIISIIMSKRIKSIKEYANWIKSNLRYIKDTNDTWALPSQTLRKKGGDCEDLSFFSSEFLKSLGYESEILVFRRGVSAHAICVFKDNGFYCYFDNTYLVKTRATDITQFAKSILNDAPSKTLYEIKQNSNKFIPIITLK